MTKDGACNRIVEMLPFFSEAFLVALAGAMQERLQEDDCATLGGLRFALGNLRIVWPVAEATP